MLPDSCSSPPSGPSLGLYIHWPWCQSICPYCDFNRYPATSVDQDMWVRAYCSILESYRSEIGPRSIQSVYFGGGTPSLMAPASVATLLEAIERIWTLPADTEITIEANPTSSESENFSGYAAAGVNRISLGIQSLRDTDLIALGRRHTVHEALAALDLAQRHVDNVSIDLIFGRPHQTTAAWHAELSEALLHGSRHLSLYQLTIEPGTGFGTLHRNGQLPGLPDEDRSADMQLLTWELCRQAGYQAYEVSSFARNGHYGRHNLLYWRYDDFLGIGPGSHSRLTLDDRRYAIETRRHPHGFLRATATRGEACRTELSPSTQAGEYLMNALRLDEGACLDRFHALGGDPPSPALIDEFVHAGWLTTHPSRLQTTLQGRLRLNPILLALLQSGPDETPRPQS